MAFKIRKTELLIFFSVFIVYSFFTILKIAGNLPLEGLSADYYIEIAENLSKSFSFSLDGINPTALRMPGYPFFLAVIFSIFKNWWAVLFIQHTIAGLSAVLLYLISKKWLSKSWAIAVSLMWAFEPYSIDISSQFFTENLYTFFLLFLIYIFINYKDKINLKLFILLVSFLLAILTYIRPSTIFLPLVFMIAMIWRDKNILKNRTLIILCIAPLYLIFLMPWSLRNHSLFQSYALSSDNASSFYISITTASQIQNDHLGYSEFRQFADSGQIKKTNELWKEATILLLKNPTPFIKAYSKNLFLGATSSYWWGSLRNLSKGSSGQVNYHKEVLDSLLDLDLKSIKDFSLKEVISATTMISGEIFWISIWILAFIGIYFLYKESILPKHQLFLFVAIIFYMVLMGSMAIDPTGRGDMGRYRFPSSPLLIFLAINGFYRLNKEIKKNNHLTPPTL